MQKTLKKILNCACEWEEVCPSLWVLIGKCNKCLGQREIQMQLGNKAIGEELRIINERLEEIRIKIHQNPGRKDHGDVK
ncbi:MAG: hypothetical protein ACFE7E_07045 [Candidatus Hodarchaeota archaeon]